MDVGRAYATLGVTDTATWGDLRRAYTARLRQCHPDTGRGDVQALQSVTDAYRELRGRLSHEGQSVPKHDESATTGRHIDVYA